MAKQAKSSSARPPFRPATPAQRHDGWTPARQEAFIEALAESGCIHEACASVGMSRQSAYRLRMRPDAQAFRIAWDAALDLAIRRLTDECLSRAIHGEVVPRFYKGEQVGEVRRYDNRLAMWLLRYRDPLRYAASLDQMVYSGHPEAAAVRFAKVRARAVDEAQGVYDRFAAEADAETDGMPFTRQTRVEEEHKRGIKEIVEGHAPIYGSYERRRALTEARADHRRRQHAEEKAQKAALAPAATSAGPSATPTSVSPSSLSTAAPAAPVMPPPSPHLPPQPRVRSLN